MKFSRRDFLGVAGLLALASNAQAEWKFLKKLKPDLSKLKPKFIGAPGTISFVAFNDIHIEDAKSASLLNHAVKTLKDDKSIEFVAVLGDISADGQLAQFRLAKQCLDKLEKPWHAIPGNHDLTANTADAYANYKGLMGDTNWTDEQSGWRFIGLDTCVAGQVEGNVSPERIEWLQNTLKHTAKDRPIALFTHHPLNPSSKSRLKNADEVLALFSGHHLRLVASGHFHGNQAEEKDGVLFITTACLAFSRENHDKTTEKGYLRVDIKKDAVEHSFVVVT